MKQIKKTKIRQSSLLLLALIGLPIIAFGQSNTLPPTGNVGIGTTTPTAALQVNGSASIDSTLTVKDSLIIVKDAHVKQKLTVDSKVIMKNDAVVRQDFKVLGETHLVGNTVIKDGTFKLKALADSTQLNDAILLIDANGKVKNGGDLKSLVYGTSTQSPSCLTDLNGNTIFSNPYWQTSSQKMYLLNNNCLPDVRLGVGVVPSAKLHLKTSLASTTIPLLIEKPRFGTNVPYKLLQLDLNGLLYAREVLVDASNWPDYVFDSSYTLPTISTIETYIQNNHHLEGVPSAEEVEQNGIKVGEMDKILLQKVEELTLLIIQQQKEIEALKKKLN